MTQLVHRVTMPATPMVPAHSFMPSARIAAGRIIRGRVAPAGVGAVAVARAIRCIVIGNSRPRTAAWIGVRPAIGGVRPRYGVRLGGKEDERGSTPDRSASHRRQERTAAQLTRDLHVSPPQGNIRHTPDLFAQQWRRGAKPRPSTVTAAAPAGDKKNPHVGKSNQVRKMLLNRRRGTGAA